ncbi:hypothetical protein [Streptomyces sp. NPDC090025]|uniref:hypothetical protein n=1 Tax=Streptomyces sp. NPDC090025 TaxID=3365922 RepID=UPI003838A089
MSIFLIFAIGMFLFTLVKKLRERSGDSRSGGAGVLSTTDRWVRDSFVPSAYGLVPFEALDTGRAGPPPSPQRVGEMQAVADAAWAGDWRRAAAYVAAAGEDWDERWSRTELLQQIANQDDSWLTAWRAAEPANGDAGTLYAALLVHRAWEIRGSEYAHKVPAERMRQFKEMLPAGMAAASKAAEADPANPGPWVVMITTARALSYTHGQFENLWAGLTARAPHHYDGHWQALQYWCGKWHGSDRAMLEFAERAVNAAPVGSPLAGMYLHALTELDSRGGTGAAKARKSVPVLTEVARSLARVDDAHTALPRLRHLLAHYLLEAGLKDLALEQFRRIGPWCGAHPWDDADDPAVAFNRARGRAAKDAVPLERGKGDATAMRL